VGRVDLDRDGLEALPDGEPVLALELLLAHPAAGDELLAGEDVDLSDLAGDLRQGTDRVLGQGAARQGDDPDLARDILDRLALLDPLARHVDRDRRLLGECPPVRTVGVHHQRQRRDDGEHDGDHDRQESVLHPRLPVMPLMPRGTRARLRSHPFAVSRWPWI
jgi:hypothetical protein